MYSYSLSLNYMIDQYATLKTLAIIAEESPNPTAYKCTPRQLILRTNNDWDLIDRDMRTLQAEELVEIVPSTAAPLFSITAKGLEKILSLEGKTNYNRK
jgi:predicted transcriptional regulator